MSVAPIQHIATTAFPDQRPGTSGLRKKTRVFMQSPYLENFIQAIFLAIRDEPQVNVRGETLIIGGDGRYFNRQAIQRIVRQAVAQGFARVMIGQGGLLSTPAMSAMIRRHQALGGILLTASHNPGGLEADFGVKYNIRNGGPAPEAWTERIFAHACALHAYDTIAHADLDLDRQGTRQVGHTEVVIVDPLSDYLALMEELFDFDALRDLFRRGFRMLFDAMHGVTGPYAQALFEERLGAPAGTVLRGTPLEDFGGHHPDPNLVHAEELVARLYAADAPDFGAACDGDGDRNLILGRQCFVSPGDSLALIAEHAATCIPGYRNGLHGIARSMPTSMAADRVAQVLGVPCYETPTGWKFFGNLMDAGLCTLCGEESFGTGSDHIREKDGLWAVLSWLSLLATTKKSVAEMLHDHWRRFGRSYYQRHDYEALDASAANAMLEALRGRLADLTGTAFADTHIIRADDFAYSDPVDGSVSARQGIRLLLADGSRVICRLSGTGTEGATLRLYLERYRTDSIEAPVATMLAPLAQAALELLELPARCGRETPTVIT